MAKLTIAEIVKQTGKSRSSIVRLIETGKLSKEKNDAGITVVDESEVFRMFPPEAVILGQPSVTPGDHGSSVALAAKDQTIQAMQDNIDTLTDQLKTTNENYARITGLLTHEQERSTTDQQSTGALTDTIKTLSAELEAGRDEQRRLTDLVTNERERLAADQHSQEHVQELTNQLDQMREQLAAVTSVGNGLVTSGHRNDQPKRSLLARIFM